MADLTSDDVRQLTRFCRQFLQLESSLNYPDAHLLRREKVQETLHQTLFAQDGVSDDRVPARYALKVLKALVGNIELAIDDWEEHGISDNITAALGHLMSLPPTPEWTAALQKMHVTYHLSLLPSAPAALRHSPDPLPLGPSITLLESRALISAGGTTGLRTWEAALHLGQYLCANPFLVSGRRVLELGAGTGYLSVLCALHLGARHVLASDGSADVVASLADAISLRRLQGGRDGEVKMAALQLQWGHALLGAELAPWHGGRGVDLVLGADVTYDARVIPALVTTLQDLVRLFPDVLVLVAATERNKETYEVFMAACRAGPEALEVTMVEEFPVPARAEQMGPFYEDRVPIHICRIGRQRPEDGPAS